MADVERGASGGGPETSTGELIRQAAEQISRLVRDELALAKAEMTQKGKKAGFGAGLLGGGGLVALYSRPHAVRWPSGRGYPAWATSTSG